jgi:hypothetical protein
MLLYPLISATGIDRNNAILAILDTNGIKIIRRFLKIDNPYNDIYFIAVPQILLQIDKNTSFVSTTLSPFFNVGILTIYAFKLLYEKIFKNYHPLYEYISIAQKEYISKTINPILTKDYIMLVTSRKVYTYVTKQIHTNEALEIIKTYEPALLWELTR